MVDIILVNWNSGLFLKKCILESKLLDIKLINRVIIVDNNSEDSSLTFLNDISDSRLILIKNKSNIGFGKACNLGAIQSKSKYILFLNTDTIISNNSIQTCFDFLESNVQYAICSLQTKSEDGSVLKSCSKFASISRLFYDSSLLSRFKPFNKLGTLYRDFDHKSSKDVEQVIGAFLFINSDIFYQAGKFDNKFFVYYDDMDLCLSVRNLGYKTRYLVENSIIHYGGKSSSFNNTFSRSCNLYSRHLFMYKHHGIIAYFLSIIISLTIDLIIDLSFRRINVVKLHYYHFLNFIR